MLHKNTKIMKKLTYFLWFLVGIASAFFAYHTYTHTRIRHKDLESVMMQNLAMEKGVAITRQNTAKQLAYYLFLIEKQGNTPKDIVIGKRAKSVYTLTDSITNSLDSLITQYKFMAINEPVTIPENELVFMSAYGHTIPSIIAYKDTSLHYLTDTIKLTIGKQAHFYPFYQQAILAYENRFVRLETKGVDRIISIMGGVIIRFDKIIAMASAKKYVLNSGEVYEAQMFISRGQLEALKYPISDCKMQISEGEIDVRGDLGEIEIKNVKAQNYNSEGKATKTLTGKITIKKADGSDTTFTLSTSYIVKKK
jgi:hypothetical protein